MGKPEDKQRLVMARGKCSNGREFPPCAITLDHQSMIYSPDPDFNVQEWEETMHSPQRTEDGPLDALLEICAKPCSRLQARRQLEQRRFSKAFSYRTITRAVEEKLLA